MSDHLGEHDALVALNRLRSNIVATQSASWSNAVYPLVAILDAAGFEVDRDPTDEQVAEHFDTYGGAGGFPGHAKKAPGMSARNLAAVARHKREKMREAMAGDA